MSTTTFPAPSVVAAPARILIVDDDRAMQAMLSEYFANSGLKPLIAANRVQMVDRLRAGPHVVILDLKLGEDDGLDLLRLIRTQSDVPVIITTGHRRDEIDRVVGLELGADDYVTKPFSPRELLARVRAILRRGGGDLKRGRGRNRIRFGSWELDRGGHAVQRGDQDPIILTKGEYGLLLAFLESPNRPLSREHLLRATRVHDDVFDRSIDVQILRLRRKLETDPSEPRLIETIRGVGYIFKAQVEAP
ncbi:response regulator transcription factor [Caulobacter segnis]|uniref:response regulator transcription factor n=1 Tax=Caulobacter segnis TaxID=88688 RepID=UPI002865250B|nr:response regulator transcription factor [Caulobacter segnis]MDR6624432.1 DNA-binding response OmpR family regulator [Caulobacter segnis]